MQSRGESETQNSQIPELEPRDAPKPGQLPASLKEARKGTFRNTLGRPQMASSTAEAEHHASQSKKAAASGWIGSALEYYDFFIYATAAALIFPQIFFPSDNPTVAIVASLATYGVGYVARPIGA